MEKIEELEQELIEKYSVQFDDLKGLNNLDNYKIVNFWVPRPE